MWSARDFCPILTKYGVSQQIFMKVSKIELHGNPARGSRADIYRRTYVMRLGGALCN